MATYEASKNYLFGARDGDLEKMKNALATSEVDVNCCDQNKSSALYLACKHGYADIVRFILESVPMQYNKKNKRPDQIERTPLNAACVRGHNEVIRILLSDERIKVDASSVAALAERGNLEMLKLALVSRLPDHIGKRSDPAWRKFNNMSDSSPEIKELMEGFWAHPYTTRRILFPVDHPIRIKLDKRENKKSKLLALEEDRVMEDNDEEELPELDTFRKPPPIEEELAMDDNIGDELHGVNAFDVIKHILDPPPAGNPVRRSTRKRKDPPLHQVAPQQQKPKKVDSKFDDTITSISKQLERIAGSRAIDVDGDLKEIEEIVTVRTAQNDKIQKNLNGGLAGMLDDLSDLDDENFLQDLGDNEKELYLKEKGDNKRNKNSVLMRPLLAFTFLRPLKPTAFPLDDLTEMFGETKLRSDWLVALKTGYLRQKIKMNDHGTRYNEDYRELLSDVLNDKNMSPACQSKGFDILLDGVGAGKFNFDEDILDNVLEHLGFPVEAAELEVTPVEALNGKIGHLIVSNPVSKAVYVLLQLEVARMKKEKEKEKEKQAPPRAGNTSKSDATLATKRKAEKLVALLSLLFERSIILSPEHHKILQCLHYITDSVIASCGDDTERTLRCISDVCNDWSANLPPQFRVEFVRNAFPVNKNGNRLKQLCAFHLLKSFREQLGWTKPQDYELESDEPTVYGLQEITVTLQGLPSQPRPEDVFYYLSIACGLAQWGDIEKNDESIRLVNHFRKVSGDAKYRRYINSSNDATVAETKNCIGLLNHRLIVHNGFDNQNMGY